MRPGATEFCSFQRQSSHRQDHPSSHGSTTKRISKNFSGQLAAISVCHRFRPRHITNLFAPLAAVFAYTPSSLVGPIGTETASPEARLSSRHFCHPQAIHCCGQRPAIGNRAYFSALQSSASSKLDCRATILSKIQRNTPPHGCFSSEPIPRRPCKY